MMLQHDQPLNAVVVHFLDQNGEILIVEGIEGDGHGADVLGGPAAHGGAAGLHLLVIQIQVPEEIAEVQITGYEYQIREAMARIRAGEIESASMPLDTTIAVMERMDALRKDWGLIYPMEQ